MTDYLHGVEVQEEQEINLTVENADISSVLVIGTKPVQYLENPQDIEKVTNYRELAQYIGDNITGYTLPDAVKTILDESGGAEIYTINVFDKEKHTSTVTKEIQLTDNKYEIPEIAPFDIILKNGDNELPKNDYIIDNNVITINSDSFDSVTFSALTATYKYADFSKIQDCDIIGTTDSEGMRTGIQKIYDIDAVYGTTPGIVIAPEFVSKDVRNAIEALSDKLKFYFYADCDKSVTVPKSEKARLKETQGVDLTTTSERTVLCAPWVTRHNSYKGIDELKPLSPVAAGLRVYQDRERNVAKSIDNTKSKTIKSTQFPISFKIDDRECDANRFNAQGILTVINHKGRYYLWGARNAAFPSKSGLMTFESARRTRDFINKSIQDTSFVCVGETITQGFIDDVLNMINSAFARWSNPQNRKEQIIYDGEAYWDSSLNTAESLANGHIYFPYKACPLATAERITFKDILDITIITKTLNS